MPFSPDLPDSPFLLYIDFPGKTEYFLSNMPNRDKRQASPMGQYYLMEEIAQGGMAKIYKGLSYDVHGIKKTVVIKKILPHIAASKEFIDSLIDEAKIAVSLSHGNIAQVYDLGRSGDDYFIVMEYVDGKSLSLIHKKCLALGKLIPIPYLCHLICELLSGLDYMHRRSDEEGRPLHIVHRDISPQNIMVSFSGTLKIIDFGIAKSAFKVGSTDSGILKGKFSYMSPEQARGDPIDHRSDIFSVGIIIHEMLTGKRLFKADDSRQTIRNVRRAKVDLPSSFREDIPEELDSIVLKALARNRRHRYAFGSDMKDDLLKFLANKYPEFKPSEVGDFLTDFFKDELSKRGREEEEAKTPVQILERTTSALTDESQFEVTGHARIHPDMKEFFLEEEDMEEEEEHEPHEIPMLAVPEEEPSYKKYPFFKMISLIKKRKSILFSTIAFVCFSISFVILLAKPWEKKPSVAAAGEAELLLTIEPPEAHVLLDGKLVGTGSPLTLKDISSDEEHTLTVEYEGHITQNRQFKLAEGEFRNFKFILNEATKPKFTLIVSSIPSGATIFINDKETANRTPAVIKKLEIGKNYSLGIYLEGYEFWTKKFEAKPNVMQNFDVQLTIDYGSLSVRTEPVQSLVLLNGAPYGQAPLTIEKLKPNKVYRIEAWKEGYKSHSVEVKISAGKIKELHISLEKEPALPKPSPMPFNPMPPTGP